MPLLLAICNNIECGEIFQSGYGIGVGRGESTVVNCLSGPCPKCGDMGRIPDGEYSLISNAIKANLANKKDIEILKNIYDILSSSISKKNFSTTKHELNKIAPHWSNVWGLLPENNTTNAIAVFTFVISLITSAITTFNSFDKESNTGTINIDNSKHYYSPPPPPSIINNRNTT